MMDYHLAPLSTPRVICGFAHRRLQAPARFVPGRLRLWSLVFQTEESHWNAR